MIRGRGLLILAGILLMVTCGCSAQVPSAATSGATPEVLVAVTRDCGKEVLLEQTVTIEPDTTALDALRLVADVETKYGGGFVSAIDGLCSEYEGAGKSKRDWFFYINGILSNIGARDYVLGEGDIEQWDFRKWGYQQYVPAIIGDFPQPFLSGYRGRVKPTIIAHEEQFAGLAQAVVQKLEEQDIRKVSVVACHQLPEASRGQGNLILLGTADSELIAELNSNQKRLGFYAYLEEDKLIVLDEAGAIAREYEAASGLVQATQNPWQPAGTGAGGSAVWIITGTDEDGVENAVDVVTNNPGYLRYAYAIVVRDGEIIRIPQ